MFRPLALFIGLRYTRAKRRNHFISFIALVSMLGIVVGIMALITVMSVMNGFDTQMRTRILGAVAHATISGTNGSMKRWEHALEVAQSQPHVIGAAPYVRGEAFLQGRRSTGALIRGVDPKYEPSVVEFGSHMKSGSLDTLQPGSWSIVIGDELAARLGVKLGDKITLYAASVRSTPIGAAPRLRRFTVTGIFAMGMGDIDSGLALINMKDAEALYSLAGPSGIRLKLDDVYLAWPVAAHLAQQLGQRYRIQTWMQTHVNLFKSLAMEKVVMFIILALIIAVAAFNLVSSLVMVVTDKQSDIAILRTLGATPRTIMRIFMVQGMVIGAAGTLLGVLAGTLLAINVPTIVDFIQNMFHVQFLPADVYYITDVPSDVHFSDVAWIAGVSFLFSLLATIYPAWRASKTQPAQALRYE